MYRLRPFLLFLVLFFASCNSSEQSEFSPSWIVGCWESEQGVLEYWKEDSIASWNATVISPTGTIQEIIKIQKCGEGFCLIPQVADQNNGQEIVFEIVKFDASSFVAENKKHDFPKLITYQRISKDVLLAKVGTAERGFDIKMRKSDKCKEK